MRVLHVLHQSKPHLAGYTIRAGYIISFEVEDGIECCIASSSQQPDAGVLREEIDGLVYHRTPPQKPHRGGVRELASMQALSKTLKRAIAEFQPDLIHAHSPILVGLPALYSAKRNKIPLVYEVRDLWENASLDRGKFAYQSPQYRVARGLESIIFKTADAVVTICDSLRDEIAPRIPASTPLYVTANGVESTRFVARDPSQAIIEKWKLKGKKVIGYIGAFQPYEGLDTLILAMPEILERIPNAHLMLTGGANDLAKELVELTNSKGLSEHITHVGRVPHSEVEDMYSVADVMAYPRILTRTTALTTPLKPLEAMSLHRPVIVSDVGAMLELVRPGETGLTFKAGDPSDLAKACIQVLENPEKSATMATAARKYVEEERDWKTIVGGYRSIYETALAK